MQLKKDFDYLRFPESVIRQAMATAEGQSTESNTGKFQYLSLAIGADRWTLDEADDFFSEFPNADSASVGYYVPLSTGWNCGFSYESSKYGTSISAWGQHRHQVRSIMNVFQQAISHALLTKLSDNLTKDEKAVNIFIGHGRSKSWEELRNHLQDKHNHKVVAFESGARAGHHVRDILEDMLDSSSLAFLVLTGEDETSDQHMRARQNVIHETGLFQGRLGFSRAIVLLEDGVENLSNLAGIQYIPFTKGHINGTFGEVLAIIKREFNKKS